MAGRVDQTGLRSGPWQPGTVAAANPEPMPASPPSTDGLENVVEVHTDGACSGNPGPGGWGWVASDGRRASGGEAQSTNQRMELKAVLEALRAIEGTVVVFSDSTYVVKCFNDRWYEGWLTRGWKTSANKPVANRDLWEPLIDLYLRRRNEVRFVWVKGHSGDPMNEIADQLAVAAAKSETALSRATDVVVPPWPIERTVWVVGAAELDGDQEGLLSRSVNGLDPGRDVLLSGLRRGVELRAAELAIAAGVTLGVILPFANPAAGWPVHDRLRFDQALGAAEWIVTLACDPAKPSVAIDQRNRWASGAAVGAVVLGDPTLSKQLDEAGLSTVSG